MLRTRFVEKGGEPAQVIDAPEREAVLLVDLSGLDESEQSTQAEQLMSREAERPFDLGGGHLLRATLIRLREREHIFLVNTHHIVSDILSMEILIREAAVLYEAFHSGAVSPLVEPAIQYVDFALWQRQWLQGEVVKRQLDYWKLQLADAPTALCMPTDHRRPALQTLRGARLCLKLSDSSAAALRALSRAENATLFMTLLAAFETLLYRYTGERDFVVGTSVHNRNWTQLEGLIGLFVELLAIRCDLSGDPGFRHLLARVRGTVLGAFENRDLPFERLVEEIHPKRDPKQTPIFQVLFALHKTARKDAELPGLRLSAIEIETSTSKYDLAMHVMDSEATLTATIEYNSELFEAATITRMLGHYQNLLDRIAANPDEPVYAIRLLTEPEQSQLLVEWNDTQRNYPTRRTVQGLFEEQAERRGDAVAVVYRDQMVSYNALNRRANRLGHYLRGLGIGTESRVGISLERSVEMVVGALGILKAGGAYVPLDPSYPVERLAYMLDDAQIEVVVSQLRHEDKLPAGRCQVVCMDRDWDEIAGHGEANPEAGGIGENLAYISYTSGSTGEPKGVEVCHRGIERLVRGAEYAKLDEEKSILQLSPLSFDASTLEIWGALLGGGKCVLYPGRMPTTDGLARAIKEEQLSTLWLTASLFNVVVEEDAGALGGVEELLVGGEALSVAHIGRAKEELRETRIINGYGPTEATTFTCCYGIREEDVRAATIPIGRPINNTEVLVLDRSLEVTPIGVGGELHIAGDGLARGYSNRAELTAEKFIPNPYGERGGERLYRSGDVVRHLSDGRIEYIGREDDQVKVRGFRIEMGEIEAALLKHPGVRQAAVSLWEEHPAEKRVVAYLVMQEGAETTSGEVRQFLKERLPEYMVPAAFVVIEALPLSPTGKIDRRALSALERVNSAVETDYAPPRDEIERAIASVWQAELRLERVGIHDNFFDLGGHSLLMIKVNRKLRELFNQDLSIVEMFEHATISRLASHINQQRVQQPSFQDRRDRAVTRKESIKRRIQHRKAKSNRRERHEQ